MGIRLSISALIQFIFFVSSMQCIYSMTCEVMHPQTAVCQATYVVKAKIINIDWKVKADAEDVIKNTLSEEIFKKPANPFKLKILQARLLRLYRGYRAVNASKGDLIYIKYPPYHLPIKQGEDYLLTGWSLGTSLQISVCDWFSRWKDLTISQKFGVKRYYYWLFCACRIRTCYGESCAIGRRGERECLLSPHTADCNSRKNICMVRRGRCDWDSPRGRTECNKQQKKILP